MLRALWNHRALIAGLVRRELQVRSARAAWGTLWLFLQPAIQVAIYTLVFGQVLQAKLPGSADALSYGIFLCAGIIPWTLFVEQVGRGQNLFLENAHLLKTTRFPRSALAVALASTSALNFALLALPFLAVLVFLGRWPGVIFLAAIPLLLLQSILGISLGIVLGTLNVFFRDIGHVVPMVLQFWFWLTPIVYPLSIVPEEFRSLIEHNPMTTLVGGYQQLVLEGQPLAAERLLPLFLLAATAAILAWLVFRSLSADLVDEL